MGDSKNKFPTRFNFTMSEDNEIDIEVAKAMEVLKNEGYNLSARVKRLIINDAAMILNQHKKMGIGFDIESIQEANASIVTTPNEVNKDTSLDAPKDNDEKEENEDEEDDVIDFDLDDSSIVG